MSFLLWCECIAYIHNFAYTVSVYTVFVSTINVTKLSIEFSVYSVRRCGGSKQEMWWLNLGDVVAQLGDVVAQLGDVVAQLVVHQTSGAEVPGSNPASPRMILGRCRIIV